MLNQLNWKSEDNESEEERVNNYKQKKANSSHLKKL